MKRRAFFLDRDGVICHLIKYPDGYDSAQRVEDVQLVKGIEKVIKTAKENNWLVIETSNQPGAAKGKQTQQLSDAIEKRTHQLLQEMGVKVDDTYICLHHPQSVIPKLAIVCNCHKPKPGLLLRAARDHQIDFMKSVFYGDKDSDALVARQVGCKSIILLHNEDALEKVLEAKNCQADYKVTSHQEALEIISQL